MIREVFDKGKDSILELAFVENRLMNVKKWWTLTDSQLTSMKYTDPVDQKEKTLKIGDYHEVRIFRAWVTYKRASGEPQDYTGLNTTYEEFDEFLYSNECIRIMMAAQPLPNFGSMPPSTMSTVQTELATFRKGIKRDASLFPIMKQDIEWDSWNRSVVSIARAQGLDQVLDSTYRPCLIEEIDLFEEKKKYMYAVFDKTMQTDKGKAIVRAHEATFDAQQVYKELYDYCTSSTRALLNSSTLLQYITSAKLGDGSWKSSSAKFILHWEEQVRQYETLIPKKDHLQETVRLQMLQNAVHPILELRQVKLQADQLLTQMGTPISYAKYISLLYSAAAQYDSQFGTASAAKLAQKRQVYAHQFEPDDDYDLDTPVGIIQANQAMRREAMMPGHTWSKISEADRAIWDQLSDDTKIAILGARSQPKPRSNSTRPPGKRYVQVCDVIEACQHLTLDPGEALSDAMVDDGNPDIPLDEQPPEDSPGHDLLAFATNRADSASIPPAHLARMMSEAINRNSKKPGSTRKTNVAISHVNYSSVLYSVSRSAHVSTTGGALVDGGSNGGLAGSEMRVIETYDNGRTVDIEGIDRHRMCRIPLGSAGAVVKTQLGPAIAIVHNYALIGTGKTIHSVGQIEAFNHRVYDKSTRVGGQQSIHTFDGYILPLNIRMGLPYLSMRPYTDEEWDTLPHIILTSEADWDPTTLDRELDDDEDWYDALSEEPDYPLKGIFNRRGEYEKRTILYHDSLDHVPVHKVHSTHVNAGRTVEQQDVDYEAMRPKFGWLPTDIIRETFKHTTQYVRLPGSEILKKRYKSPFPALNVHRREEPVAMDTVYSDVAAIDDGSTCAQIYVGTKSTVTDVYGMRTEKQLVNTLEDNIRDRGAMKQLLSDSAQSEISKRILDILRTLCIPSWQSEPHQQHQNPCERRIQDVKRMTNTLLDRSGSLASTWLLAMAYVCFLLNHTYNGSIRSVPITVATGSTPDISPLLAFAWWEPVYYKVDDSSFPSDTREKRGRFVGIAENVGHRMTFKVLTDDTNQVICRSNLRSALDSSSSNLRLDPIDGESIRQFVKFREDSPRESPPADSTGQSRSSPSSPPSEQIIVRPILDPADIIGRSFLKDQDNGERHRVQVIQLMDDHMDQVEQHPERIKFLCRINEEDREELIAYNEILNYLEAQEQDDVLWKFRRIVGHEGPLAKGHPDYNGSTYNVQIEWENGEITSEPLNVIASDDPVTCAVYARENSILDLPGWKRFKSIAKREKKFLRMVNQAKLRSYSTAKRYKYGFQVPRNYEDAVRIDRNNRNTKWQEAVKLELDSVNSYDVFIDNGSAVPADHRKIRVHLVFDVKHDGRHKARLVADGHLTDVPLESVYSGVVSLRGIRILVFLAELNQLETWATDIGNAYLEAVTSEKLYIIAGAEFGDLKAMC